MVFFPGLGPFPHLFVTSPGTSVFFLFLSQTFSGPSTFRPPFHTPPTVGVLARFLKDAFQLTPPCVRFFRLSVRFFPPQVPSQRTGDLLFGFPEEDCSSCGFFFASFFTGFFALRAFEATLIVPFRARFFPVPSFSGRYHTSTVGQLGGTLRSSLCLFFPLFDDTFSDFFP